MKHLFLFTSSFLSVILNILSIPVPISHVVLYPTKLTIIVSCLEIHKLIAPHCSLLDCLQICKTHACYPRARHTNSHLLAC